MPYSEFLADRIRQVLADKNVSSLEKKMMGGLCFMVDDQMCFGVVREELMARIGPDAYESALEKPGCRAMDFTGRPMKGYVFLDSSAIDMDADLAYWVQLCLDFNPLAKSSKKKKRNK